MARHKKIVGFTGHRKLRHSAKELAALIKEALLQIEPVGAISGMALGFDQLAARVCIKLGIPFIAAVPTKAQPNIWIPAQIELYYKILDKAHKVVYVDTVQGYKNENADFISKLHTRNEWIVSKSTHLVAYQQQNYGGTVNALKHAHAKGFRRTGAKGLGLTIWENLS